MLGTVLDTCTDRCVSSHPLVTQLIFLCWANVALRHHIYTCVCVCVASPKVKRYLESVYYCIKSLSPGEESRGRDKNEAVDGGGAHEFPSLAEEY